MLCGHSFCHGCLARWSFSHRKRKRDDDDAYELKCPTCNTTFDLPERGVFGVNYALLDSLDARPKHSSMCLHHREEVLILSCKPCESLVCASCICETHKGHDVEPIKQAYERRMAALRERSAAVQPYIDSLSLQRQQILADQGSLDIEKEESAQAITDAAEQAIRMVRARESRLKAELEEHVLAEKHHRTSALQRCDAALFGLDRVKRALANESKSDMIEAIQSHEEYMGALRSAEQLARVDSLEEGAEPKEEKKFACELDVSDLKKTIDIWGGVVAPPSPSVSIGPGALEWLAVPGATKYEVQIADYHEDAELGPYCCIYLGSSLSCAIPHRPSAFEIRVRSLQNSVWSPFSHVMTWHRNESNLRVLRGSLGLFREFLYTNSHSGFSSARSTLPLSFSPSANGSGDLVATFSIVIQRLLERGEVMVGVCGERLDCGVRGQWVGRVDGFSYRSGHGIKIQDGRCADYGEPYGVGDTVRVELNRSKRTITFFKNDQSQGVAFQNVSIPSPVYAAVSMNAAGSVSLI